MADSLDTKAGTNYYLDLPQPHAMIQTVRAVVHGDETPEKALDLYHSLKSMEERNQYAK